MSHHDTSPSPSRGSQDGTQDTAVHSSQSSNIDSSNASLESSFQLDSSFSSQVPDSEKHPKGKRKRTTTQDKAILEAAYISNPKPDKAARLEIVKRVSLNEKEAQIWFQNRRQNDRRKSRPLSPQEIAALRFGGGMHVLSDPAYGHLKMTDSFEATEAQAEDAVSVTDRRPPSPDDAASQYLFQLSRGAAEETVSNAAEIRKDERRDSNSGTPPSSQNGEAPGENQVLSQSLPSSVGYLSNRWNVGTSFSTPSTLNRPGDESLRLDAFPSSANTTANNSPVSILPPPFTSSSQFRLSLSLEGKAEVVNNQLSPPRSQISLESATLPPVRSHRTLHRSRSALTLPPISTLTASLPPQLTSGRSRDVHAWEYVCDAEIRDELTAQAENESSGSAIAAISLLRSSSQTSTLSNMVNAPAKNVLQPSSSKRNAPPTRRDSSKKVKLSRSSSSIGRMRSLPPPARAGLIEKVVDVEADKENLESLKKTSKVSLGTILSPSSGDSDKENWNPDEGSNPMARRRALPAVPPATAQTQRGNPRRVGRPLADQALVKRTTLGAARANTAPAPRLRGSKGVNIPVKIFEDDDGDVGQENRKPKHNRGDEEVERFMRGPVSPSKKPDMDCIAGLLSLSQGNWR